jgi:hypothetical protein
LKQLISTLERPETVLRRLEDTKGGLLDDAFRWVLDNSEFQKWHSHPQSQLLWIKGDPGKGKTMLLIGIIKELLQEVQSQQLESIAYFFCQATDPKLNNATNILRGLIYMLIEQQPNLISHLRRRYDSEESFFESGNLFYSLSAVFEDLVQHSTNRTIYLLVDALDECEVELPQLLGLITKTKSVSSVSIKWLVSSRNRADIEQLLECDNEEDKLSLELNAHHVSDAVAIYIKHKVSRLVSLRHDNILLENIKEQLLQKSDGTFLWVALVIEDLKPLSGPRVMLEVLEGIPKGLTSLYNRMIGQIEELEDRDLCLLLLSLITLAFRPLHIQELCRLTGLKEQNYGLAHLRNVMDRCGSFLNVRNDYVFLIHQSAKDHLSGVHGFATVFPAGHSRVHSRMFRRSLEVISSNLRRNIYGLSLENPGISVSQIASFRPDPDPLFDLRYSCTYWLDHFFEIESRSTDMKEPTEGATISHFLEKHLLHWLESLGLIGEVRHGILALKRLAHRKQVCGVKNY